MQVDALVALEPDEARPGCARERLGDLRLAHAGLALDQQRLLEGGGQTDRDGEAPVGEVALACQSLSDGFGAVEAHASDAVSSARRVSTRAKWRL